MFPKSNYNQAENKKVVTRCAGLKHKIYCDPISLKLKLKVLNEMELRPKYEIFRQQ